jgi:hypothetical protein
MAWLRRTHSSLLALAVLTAPLAAATEQKPVPTARLEVNTDDAVRHSTSVSLRDGLAALEDTVFGSEYEESWIYDAAGQWIETGVNASGWGSSVSMDDLVQGIMRTRSRVQTDTKLYAERYAHGGIMADIHIHPVKNSPDYKRARFEDDYRRLAAAIALVKIRHATPSRDDLNKILYELALSKRGQCEFMFYIASFGGVTALSLTETGRAYAAGLLDDKPAADAFIDGIHARVLEAMAHEVAGVKDTAPLKNANTVIDYAALLRDAFAKSSDEHFRIRYASYRDLDRLFGQGRALTESSIPAAP